MKLFSLVQASVSMAGIFGSSISVVGGEADAKAKQLLLRRGRGRTLAATTTSNNNKNKKLTTITAANNSSAKKATSANYYTKSSSFYLHETMSIPLTVPMMATDCTDTPGFVDALGADCAWYEMNDAPGCPTYGEYTQSQWNGELFNFTPKANDNCCYCFDPSDDTVSPTSAPTLASEKVCNDNAFWSDELGHTCDWYQSNNVPYCPISGYFFDSRGGKQEKEALYPCCYCAENVTMIDPYYEPDPTCNDTPEWVDVSGDGCEWYEASDAPGCPNTGDYTGFDQNTGEPLAGGSMARDNCCYCAVTPTSAPTSAAPTSAAPTSAAPISSGETTSCTDTPGWLDSFGDSCVWYELTDLPGCPQYGDLGWYNDSTGVANDNCCYCAGTSAPTPTVLASSFTPTPTHIVTSPPSAGDTPCQDTPGWVDHSGNGCDWYKIWDTPGCPWSGNFAGYDIDGLPLVGGSVARDNCCYCAGTDASKN